MLSVHNLSVINAFIVPYMATITLTVDSRVYPSKSCFVDNVSDVCASEAKL